MVLSLVVKGQIAYVILHAVGGKYPKIDTKELSGSVMNATFNVNQIVNTANIDYVTLLVGKTSFVDDVSYLARQDFRNLQAGALNLSMDMSGNANFTSAKALFARVGVRTVGADQAIYSDIVRLK